MARLREKIHHLDDMLKSQQRKVRQMIEQVRRPRPAAPPAAPPASPPASPPGAQTPRLEAGPPRPRLLGTSARCFAFSWEFGLYA